MALPKIRKEQRSPLPLLLFAIASPHCIANAANASTAAPAVVKPVSNSSFGGSGVDRGSCRNPLFATHWAGKSDIRHLMGEPTLQYDLTLCPMYNGQLACCPTAFEEVQQRSFRRWVTHWKRKIQYVKDFQMDMEGTKVSTAYVKSNHAERGLFDKALQSFNAVLRSYGTCFDTILEYMAGMLCFTCDPQWRFKVHMDPEESRVEHLRIHDSSNDALWQSCSALGRAAHSVRMRVAESALAKSIWTRFEDLSMFESKIDLARYMRHHGLFVLRGKNENVLKVEAGTHALERTLKAFQPTIGGDDAAGLVYPVRDGRSSGFRCKVFPRQPEDLSSGAQRWSARLQLSLNLCVVLSLAWG